MIAPGGVTEDRNVFGGIENVFIGAESAAELHGDAERVEVVGGYE